MLSVICLEIGSWPILVIRGEHLIFDLMKSLSHLLPAATGFRFDSCNLDQAQAEITLTLTSRQRATHCPLCHVPGSPLHSRYRRTLADLPWGSCTVRLWLWVRRLSCDHVGCTRRIFAERLPGLVAPQGCSVLLKGDG